MYRRRRTLERTATVATQLRTVIVVDDERIIADTLVMILQKNGFSALAVYDGASALDLISAKVPDLLISDVSMSGMNGIELGIKVRERFPGCEVLLFSGHAATTNLMDEARKGGHDFQILSKPIHPRDLLQRLQASCSPQ
jgi:DNA-binding NtrC family response regulator